MAKLVPNSTGASASRQAPKMGAPSNVNHDKSLTLRAPRIRAISTRNYGKGAPNPYPDMNQTDYGTDVGFGPQQKPSGS